MLNLSKGSPFTLQLLPSVQALTRACNIPLGFDGNTRSRRGHTSVMQNSLHNNKQHTVLHTSLSVMFCVNSSTTFSVQFLVDYFINFGAFPPNFCLKYKNKMKSGRQKSTKNKNHFHK